MAARALAGLAIVTAVAAGFGVPVQAQGTSPPPSSFGSVQALAGCGLTTYIDTSNDNNIETSAVQNCSSITPLHNGAQIGVIQQAVDGLQTQILGSVLPGFGPSIFASGRYAATSHNGETLRINPTFKGPGYDTTEVSGLANAEFALSKQQNSSMRAGFYAGYANIDVNYAFQQAKGANDSGMFGAYGLYTLGQSYVMAMATGDIGQTDYTLRDIGNRGSYDTKGVLASLTAGHVLSLSPNWFLDVRGSLGYGHHLGDSHIARATVATSGDFRVGETEHEVFFGTATLTLYTIVKSGGTVYQPFVKVGIKNEFDEKSTLKIPAQIVTAGGLETTITGKTIRFSDADLYGNAEVGINAQLSKNWEGGVAAYVSGSSDELTYGGRVGLKYKFD